MPNWSGAVQGATTGATAGSTVLPGWGTAIGAIGGALGGLFSNKDKANGQKDQLKQFETLLPEQKAQLMQYLQQVQQMQQPGGNYDLAQQYNKNMLSGDPQAYEKWAAPYQTQFNEQILPGIAERYAGMTGAMGNPGQSSGFGQAVGGAATQYGSNLAGLYAQLQQQAAQSATNQYNQLGNTGLNTQAFGYSYQPGNLGFLNQAMQGIFGGVGQAAGQKGASAFADLFSKGPTKPAATTAPQPPAPIG